MTQAITSARLGNQDVASVILGQSPPSSAYNEAGDGLPFFQGKVDFGLIHPTPRVWCNAGRKFATAGDILISVRAPVGNVNIARDHCAIGRGIAAIRSGPLSDPWFLYFALLYAKPVLERMATGSTFASVNRTTLNDLDIPFLDKPEQAEIGLFLRSLVYQIEQEEQALHTAQALKHAAMDTLFTRGLRGEAQKETEIGPVPESWELKLISDHFTVVSGGTPSRRVQEFWMDGTIPWVKTAEVDYCVIRKTEECITRAGLEQSAAKVLPPGTLLLAMYGQGVTRGKVAILGIESTCNQACAAISPDDNAVDSKYLYHFLLFRYESIRQMAHGGQQQNLNLEIVRNLPIPVPPDKDLQGEVVDILDAIDHKIDLHRRKRAVLDELFKALLHKLMTGEVAVRELNLPASV